MINIKALKPWLIIGSLVLIFLNYNIFLSVESGIVQDIAYTAITLSLLPAAVLILALFMLRGESRVFKMAVGVMALMYAAEFCADPWAVSLRMDLGLSLEQIIIYNVIGAFFLFISIYAFKQV